MGDIVSMRYCDVLPFDMLILDSTDQRFSENIVRVNERQITGRNYITMKRAIRNFDIKSINTDFKNKEYTSHLLRALSGHVEYDCPTKNSFKFNGIFKLKNDPKVTKIIDENIVYGGSKIYSRQ